MTLSVRLRCALFALILCVPISAHADKVDDYVREQMRLQHIPGLSLAVVRNGSIVKAKGYGYCDMEHGVRARADTVYELASVSKQFTASAIMLLYQDGKIGLDDPLSKYIAGTPDSWKEITLRETLTHTSGLAREPADASGRTGQDDISEEEMLKIAESMPLLTPPGTHYSYSNLGFNLLALVVERVSHQPFDKFVRERIFAPLGMTATRVNDLRAVIRNRACGYRYSAGALLGAAPISPTRYFGAGAIVSNVLDLAKWDLALYTDNPLTAASRKVMWSPMVLKDGKSSDYGFGWGIEKVKSHPNISHNGLLDGYQSYFTRFPEDQVSVIVLINQTGSASPDAIGKHVARFYLPGIRPVPPKAVSVKAADLTPLAGRYEFANNNMLTIRAGAHGISGHEGTRPDTYYVATSQCSFWEGEEESTLRFLRDAAGQVTGIAVKPATGTERTIPRIGPLPSKVAATPDPDPGLTARAFQAVKELQEGGAPVNRSTVLTPGAKADFAPGPVADFAGTESLAYIATFDLSGRGIERHGGKVAKVIYYRLKRDSGDAFLQIYVTADRFITDEDVVDD